MKRIIIIISEIYMSLLIHVKGNLIELYYSFVYSCSSITKVVNTNFGYVSRRKITNANDVNREHFTLIRHKIIHNLQ